MNLRDETEADLLHIRALAMAKCRAGTWLLKTDLTSQQQMYIEQLLFANERLIKETDAEFERRVHNDTLKLCLR